MTQAVSDVAFELLGACVHSLRFAFGAPLRYPHAPVLPDEGSLPPALFRRIQVASPPPPRAGLPWHTGMTCAGEPFRPDDQLDDLSKVQCDEGVASLDTAEPETIVLDEWFRIERNRRPMEFPGRDEGKWLSSTRYWSPIRPGRTSETLDVDYYGEYRFHWTRAPQEPWVALSFEGFFPPERDSADVIIPIGECDESCR